MNEIANRLVERLDELGKISDHPEMLVRTFLSPAHLRANEVVGQWMHDAGLTVTEDAFGNLVGARVGPPGSKTLLIGSHLDTVIDAGKFDGALGVLLGIAVAESFLELPFGLEIAGFSDEEGVRFQSTYLGSQAYCGVLDPKELERRDDQGISLAEAVRARNVIPQSMARHAPAELLGYLEIHIEQGPVLEKAGLPLGVVSAIAGQTRVEIGFTGKAGHAGTVPMDLRKDALAAAAEMIVAVEQFAKTHPPLVATVGSIQVSPGAGNVIPGSAIFSLEVRGPDDDRRIRAVEQLSMLATNIATRRGLEFTWVEKLSADAVSCDPNFTSTLSDAVQFDQPQVPEIFSGAGHDAVILSRLCPVAMLFVRCRDGLSHHPDEFAAPKDIAAALLAVQRFIRVLSKPLIVE